MTLDNEVALITGASRGIGKCIALALGKAGATVIGTATSDKGAQAISDYLSAEGITGLGLCMNVTTRPALPMVLNRSKKNSVPPVSWSIMPGSPAITC